MMNKENAVVAVLYTSLLLSTAVAADTRGVESMQATCLSESENNRDQLQQGIENWATGSRRGSQTEYEQRIAQIESSRGVYDDEIVPELIGLGFLFQEQKNYADASRVIQRALHIVRVNEGLYSTRQLPIIDLLIESNSKLENWKQVADSYDRMYWLYRRNYEKNDPRQLHALKRLRRWYIESYNKDTGRSLKELFSSAETLYAQGLKIMLACTGNKRESLCFWHKSCCADAGTTHGKCPVDQG